MVPHPPIFSVITPSRGDRPRALAAAIRSVAVAARHTFGGDCGQVEMLLGFDGVKGIVPDSEKEAPFVRSFDLPFDGDFGNAIRRALIKAAKGQRFLFVDDDNILSEKAFSLYAQHPDADLVIGRIDTTRAFDVPFLPRDDARETVRPGNVDPLCLCIHRELLVTRCNGWSSEGGYESDYLNILRYARRARKMVELPDVVGVYDAGQGMDAEGQNPRQQRRTGA